ncbi:S-adenosyl-L-methionine-dependent methyltransferase [Xylariomycetidae sp. FL0641]|nr:S-adenosyl-L-methionine-dependent methyltransferase [Xylariomycetidae sp. FL0641]
MSSDIVELATRIASNTSKLHAFLESRGLPPPSFAVDGPLESQVPPDDEPEIEAARRAIVDDTEDLRCLVLGPRDYLMSQRHNALLGQQAIVRFRLAHTFPVGQTTTFREIAAASGLREPDVRQFLRLATLQRVFAEPRPGVVAHTAASRLLAEDRALSDWVAASTDDLWQAAAQTCNAVARYPGSQEPSETGFSLANHTDQPIYEVFSQFPERARRFANAMRAFTQSTGFALRHVAENFPWADIPGGGTVVDVGGSQGHVCAELARRYPTLRFVVQDLAPVIAAAQQDTSLDAAIRERITFAVHDFLTPQPVRGADVYLFRWIFHNWSDKYCVRILRGLIPALKPGARVLVNDSVLPEPGSLSRWQEYRIRSTDLTMKEITNSRERELGDWEKLFEMADSRFQFQGGKQPAGSDLWILVAEWKGDLSTSS